MQRAPCAQRRHHLQGDTHSFHLDSPSLSSTTCRYQNFQGTSGKAYLFDTAVNVCTGPPEERMLMTGLHVVLDLYCNTCWSPVGWKYKEAHNASEKYKEGKFILELAKTDQLP
ncbi:hypothetical protein F441_00745 [Phytophthora nicotianae CJ01A1]|uniref:Protein yippee-like n=6 Tax=Phytophthora nicotianae TaxID=4792 RepID=W2RFJ8_PHYN3|nr:hypothetical protein PPTG_00636 [Phytophthora nicotianae INRA-310]ETI56882.1 hypothetical protein F443_00755 [Phytophthora nicotianae P1569]ETK96658.1 hypothetical protein L915_00705 [Phytophthora nicotianae]ETO85616.1 hypothetical protein F444_00759 [Phytophthora nicotianae P1976]ETP26661.1 hypothetical protein F441_00745 [Phytophthora nicotianae CJ01A1]ETP54660.1 hypothetical protein F442_00706 [Phytophthora nicotianae P10297]